VRYLLCVLFLLVTVSAVQANIGTVTSHTGNGCELIRDKNKLTGNKGTSIKSLDTYVTSSCVGNITFKDDTQVRITENSRLLIDDFVFDPAASDSGRLALKVGMGTVRYASGQISKNNPQQVNIKTPTATIAVRGTDFTMTVDETGQSLIVLLPSCKDPLDVKQYELQENRCQVGQIDVTTLTGTVTLNQAFHSTYVSSASAVPTPATLINTVESKLSNNLIIVKPVEVVRAIRESAKSQRELELEELEADAQRALASRVRQATEEIQQTLLLPQSDNKNRSACNIATSICVRLDNGESAEERSRGIGTAQRLTESEHYAEVKTAGYGSSTSITIIHNDTIASELIGDANTGGSNTVVIKQSTGVLRR
jgi:hypothetical protein